MTTEQPLNNRKRLPMNAVRVCDAIAKIGYTPAAALMDLTDNSVTAGATQVHLSLHYEDNYARKGNVSTYQIFDNGCGMDEAGIENALTLGSEADYSANSLSKFGMGLKSAGFSLGGKITVFSKKDGTETAWTLDRKVVEEEGAYVIEKVEAFEELKSAFEETLGETDSGTLISITDTGHNNNESAKKTIEKLTTEVGIVYYMFLNSERSSIKISSTGKPTISITPIDILHKDDAAIGYDPDTYDCKQPCISYDEEIPVGDGEDCPKVRLEISLFPQSSLKNYAEFTREERDQIAKYKVGGKHKGFFIYRNDRLIRWGDNLDGIVSRDKYGFRARLSLKTIHDDYLHVDVSKQHLNIPEDVLSRIERACQQSLRWHDEIFGKCNELLRPNEGERFNERNSDLAEEDVDDGPEIEQEQSEERTQRLLRETRAAVDEEDTTADTIPGDDTSQPLENEAPQFDKVRYSERVRSGILWDTLLDPTDGTFIRINKNHHFYETVLLKLEEDSPERQSIEALLWCLGVGENKAKSNLRLEYEDIEKVISKIKRSASFNLENWSSENQDVFTDA